MVSKSSCNGDAILVNHAKAHKVKKNKTKRPDGVKAKNRTGESSGHAKDPEVRHEPELPNTGLRAAECPPAALWYSIPLPDILEEITEKPQEWSTEDLLALRQKAETLHAEECKRYKAKRSRSAKGTSFEDMAISGQGTKADRIAALSIRVRDSPLHHLAELEEIQNIATDGKPRDVIRSLDALRDLYGGACRQFRSIKELQGDGIEVPPEMDRYFGGAAQGFVLVQVVGGVLPPHRSLHLFRNQPGLVHRRSLSLISHRELVIWHFEEKVRLLYHGLLMVVERLAHSPTKDIRVVALRNLFNLISAKPLCDTQDSLRLLLMAVADRSLASSAAFYGNLLALQRRFWPSFTQAGEYIWDYDGITATVVQEFGKALFADLNWKRHDRIVEAMTKIPIPTTPGSSRLAFSMVQVYFSYFKHVWAKAKQIYDQDESSMTQIARRRVYRKINRQKKYLGKEPKKARWNVEEGLEKGLVERLVASCLTGIRRALPFVVGRDWHKQDESRDVNERMGEAPNEELSAAARAARIDAPDEDGAIPSTIEKVPLQEIRKLADENLEQIFQVAQHGSTDASPKIQALMILIQITATMPEARERVAEFVDKLVQRGIFVDSSTSRFSSLLFSVLFKVIYNEEDPVRARRCLCRLWDTTITEQAMEPGYIVPLWWLTFGAGFKALKARFADVSGVKRLAGGDKEARASQIMQEQSGRFWQLLPLQRHYHPAAVVVSQFVKQATPLPVSLVYDPIDRFSVASYIETLAGKQSFKAREASKKEAEDQPFAKSANNVNFWVPSKVKRAHFNFTEAEANTLGVKLRQPIK